MPAQIQCSADHLRRLRRGVLFLIWGTLCYFLLALLSFLSAGYYGYRGGFLSFVSFALILCGLLQISNAIQKALLGADAAVPAPQRARSDVPMVEKRGLGSANGALGDTGMIPPDALSKKQQPQPLSKQPPPLPKKSPVIEVNWEEWVGKKLLQKIGIIIVLIGMIVLLKYSFDNRLIGELGRIGLGAFGGAILLGAGEFFRRKYPDWFQAFTGGGLVLLYFTVWVARVFYREELLQAHDIAVSAPMATFLYGFITVIGALAAIRYRSQVVAWFTVLGGYLTPLLIASDPNPDGLVTYLAILAVGILLLSWKGKWPYIGIASFVLTQFYLNSPGAYLHPGLSDIRQFVIAVGYFALFGVLPVINQFSLRKQARPDEILMIIANAVLVFTAVVDAVGGFAGEYVGLAALGLAAVMLAYAGAALARVRDDVALVNIYLVATVILVALALYAELEMEWVMVGWAPLSALLVFVAVRLRQRGPWVCALLLLIGSIFFLVLNTPVVSATREELWHPFTSSWALKNYAVLASLLVWIRLSKGLPQSLVPGESRSRILTVAHLLVAVLLFVGVTFEATALDWTIDLPWTFAYILFALVSLVVFFFAQVGVWLIAAAAGQAIALVFIFAAGDSSGMVSPLFNGAATAPIVHPWALASAAALLVTAALAFVVAHERCHMSEKGDTRTALVAVALAQVWAHVTVEIQHMQAAYGWSELFGDRAISGWWIVFAIAVAAYGFARRNTACRIAGAYLAVIPFAKDMWHVLGGEAGFYETILWTALPLAVAWTGVRTRTQKILIIGVLLLFAAAVLDMLTHLAEGAGFVRTTWWAIAGLATMVLGFTERSKILRQLAMFLFAATIVKLLVLDFATLDTGVRIGASIATGLLLIGASYLYQRFDSHLTARK